MLHRDKERASDEKQVEKLFRDITNGMLRRKRGADYDLSDSDDGGEARRRMKRKEFAKMRKALLEDERIGKIAENPKKMAFLRAIEDRGSDDEMDFLDDFAEPGEPGTDFLSQSQGEDSQKVVQVSNSQPDTIMGPPKRKLPHDTEPEARLPPHLRRTRPAKRPTNLSEIRQSLSSLIEEPNAILASHSGSDSDSEDDHENGDETGSGDKHKGKENHDPFASRRTASIAVVDRISLKRAASNATSTTTRLAFAAPSATADGFKIPSLLRRSTTSTSLLSTSNSSSSLSGMSGTERTAGGARDDKTVAKKAGKNSGVNYFARENERKAKVEAGEKRRKERRFKGAEGRRRVVGGLFGSGKFE
jgi:mediator of replication checkpoint protein 1